MQNSVIRYDSVAVCVLKTEPHICVSLDDGKSNKVRHNHNTAFTSTVGIFTVLKPSYATNQQESQKCTSVTVGHSYTGSFKQGPRNAFEKIRAGL